MGYVVLSESEQEKLSTWLASRSPAMVGAIAGRFVYTVCPTHIGTVVKVRDDCTGEEVDLTDYSEW